MTNYEVTLLQYEEEKNHFQDVRMVEIEWESWFVASDVAKVLGYKKPNNAIWKHCKPKGALKRGILTKWGVQEVTLINEPNVYRLIISSKLESAEKFENWLFEEVLPQIRKKGFYGKVDRSILPNFVQRFIDNIPNIPRKYFSIIGELFLTIYSELEKVGYKIPDKSEKWVQIMPDISVGRVFSEYLQKHHPERYHMKKEYMHLFPDGRKHPAALYPSVALGTFRDFVFDVWVPKYANDYFKSRDPLALNYIPQILWVSENDIAKDSKKITPRLKAVKQTVKKEK